jgi:hypothetical protein
MSAVYPNFREQLIDWAINQSAPAGLAFYVIGVDSSYVYSAAHVDLVDVIGGSIQASEQPILNVTYVDGIINGDDVEFSGLTLAEEITALIVYLKDGIGDSYLAAYIDESTNASLPATIGTSTGLLSWNASGIFRV